MKIAFIGAQQIHTTKWTNSMVDQGHEIFLITMHPDQSLLHEKVTRYVLPIKGLVGYYLNSIFLKALLKKISPDVVNTHYASGYGTLARLAGSYPNLLSVWGSDVHLVPLQSAYKRRHVQKNLAAADYLAATGHALKEQTQKVLGGKRPIFVTPFGVDCSVFIPRKLEAKKRGIIRIGTIKRMKPVYGISTLIRAFAVALEAGLESAELVLVGGGPQENDLKQLALELNIHKQVKFVGSIPHAEVPGMLSTFDIYMALSISESFGVAVLEASACGKPVITSDVGGLPEVVRDGQTGFLVPPNNPQRAAEKIILLAKDHKLRCELGRNGRDFVLANYAWKECVSAMELVYETIARESKKVEGRSPP
jgi:L-malate glycosyltransferase